MNDFKVGDPVEYFGTSPEIRELSPFIISAICGSGDNRYVKIKGLDRWEPWLRNLRHVYPIQAPDVITINRADLPEVAEVDGSLHCGHNSYFTDPEFGAAEHRQLALQQLAVAEFLEARDKAAEEAIHKRDERRADLDCLSRTALIECIIDLEASHD